MVVSVPLSAKVGVPGKHNGNIRTEVGRCEGGVMDLSGPDPKDASSQNHPSYERLVGPPSTLYGTTDVPPQQFRCPESFLVVSLEFPTH